MKGLLASLAKRQFCPTSGDIENDELKKLAERLKGDSEKETLTNILDWQARNIQFWWERWLFALLLVSVFAVFVVVLFLYWLFPILFPILCGCLGAIIFALGYLSIRYWIFLGEKPIKEKFPEFFEIVYDTFRPSLPVDKIIKFEKYRLAVCRDLAKLTASLLFRVYPDSEVYFIFIKIPIIKLPKHVAAAIKIKNKCYVLNQHLPILTINDWLIKQNKEKACTSKLERDPKGRQKVTLGKQKPITKDMKVPKINTEKLTEEIAEIFGIEPTSHIDNPDFEIRLHNYDDDEITKYSLIRKIKNRLEREFCDNTDKMLKINISQKSISVKIKET